MFGMGKKIDAMEITTEVDNGSAILVDVRRDDEWNASHATGAVHLPIDRIMGGELPTQDTSKKLYLYCGSGGRAGRATHFLKSQGFEAKNLGGLTSWKRAGGSVEYT